jgi:putative membrane-bound dehydrogenase-like protein
MRHLRPILLFLTPFVLASGVGLRAAGIPVFNSFTNAGGPMPADRVAAGTPLPDGFRLSVFAAEPDVQQPIAMATDPRGRLWVAENYTYSERAVGYHTGLRDRILVFEDADNDGHFDKRTVFWDGAERLTSVETGQGGVWALALPNLVFIPDKDGDGIPDGPPQVILDGFEYQTGRHTVANGLRWGPDGWLYGRHGIQSTSLVGAPGTPPERRTAMNVGIWRYHPGRRVFEVVAQGTTNPWGMDWDARGELFFINTVIGHLWHVVPGAHFRRMYGDDPTPRIYEQIEQTADHVHWASGEDWTTVRKGVSDLTSAAGGGHAHTGLLVYQGGQFPESWNGKALMLNLHGRRLNVDELVRRGAGYVAHHRADAFPFPDPWFRGIDLIPAPDGGVFVSDWSDTGECHNELTIHRTSGRIYKITYGPPSAPPKDLTRAGDMELVRAQADNNDWETRQSRRVLADRSRAGTLSDLARTELHRLASESADEILRLRALWALHVIEADDVGILDHVLTGTETERAWGLRFLEDAKGRDPARTAAFDEFVRHKLPALIRAETSCVVRLTASSLLQKLPLDQRAGLAAALLEHEEDAGDHEIPLMLWYGIEPLAATDPRFANLVAGARIPRVQRLGARRLAEDVDAAPAKVDALLGLLLPTSSQRIAGSAPNAVLDGLAEGLSGRRKAPAPANWRNLVAWLTPRADASLRARIRDLSALFGDGRALDEIRSVALDSGADLPRRRAALQSLVDARADGLREICEKLLPVHGLAATAAAGLAVFDDSAVASRILAEWGAMYGLERPPVMNVLLSRRAWAAQLLDAIAAGRVSRQELSVAQARRLRDYKDDALTRRLGEVWGVLQDPDEATKRQALDRWRAKLTPDAVQAADAAEGRKLFTASCGLCHKLYGAGADVGPDLTGSGRRNLDYLLENILFPSAVVAADYRQTTLELKDGRTLSGIIRNRTPRTLTLVAAGDATLVTRDEITKEETSPLSLMPEGLIDNLTQAQVANLFAYLMSGAPPVEGR